MILTKKIEVSELEAGFRIEVLCAQKFPEISRSQWQKYGSFFCERIAKKGKTKTRTGDVWEVSCKKESVVSDTLEAWDFPLKILKETKDWVVIEKPEGISVHPSSSEKSQETIVNALIFQFGKNLSQNSDQIEGQKILRPGIVHRLDKPTSGVLLIAKNNQTHKKIQENWKQTEKFYYAVVQGNPPQKGKIEGAIFRDLNNRKKMAVSNHEKAKEAITLFEKVQQKGHLALLKIQILTGRTHQIRVHLSSIGFPILGDELYGGKKANRIFLHAQKLSFPDFLKEKTMVCVESALPSEFLEVFE